MPTKCWHANRPGLPSSDDAARTNRAIAKIARRVEEEAIARRIEVPADSMPRRGSPIERSYRVPRRRGRPVLSVVSWPSSRGHSSRRTSPTSLYLDAARRRPNKKKGRRGERGMRASFPFASSNITSRNPVLSSGSPSCFRWYSRKHFLRHINSR